MTPSVQNGSASKSGPRQHSEAPVRSKDSAPRYGAFMEPSGRNRCQPVANGAAPVSVCSCSARQGRSREEDPPCSADLPLDLEWTFAHCSLLASRGAFLGQCREGERCASREHITRDGRALEIVARVDGRGHVSCCLGEL